MTDVLTAEQVAEDRVWFRDALGGDMGMEAIALSHEALREQLHEAGAEIERLSGLAGQMYGFLMVGRTSEQIEMITSGEWRNWKPRTVRRKLRRHG